MLAFVSSLAACSDELPFADNGTYGDGESRVSMSMEFKTDAAGLGTTRSTKGDTIRDINNVFVVWYHSDSTLAGSKYLPKESLVITEQPRGFDETEETPTQHADFTCDIPYGVYRIYAAVNVGDLTGDTRIDKEGDFRNIKLSWKGNNIPANNQMSGYFVNSDDVSFADGNAPEVTLNKPNMILHSWVRRAASKVTIAFDAQKLNENIYIYIKSAQIKDIPKECSLVSDNKPAKVSDLYTDGDTIMYGQGDNFEKDHENWPWLACGRGVNQYGSHDNDAKSLFFYENMQGKHADKHKYNNFKEKDSVMCGTYVEVEAYYVNYSLKQPSEGKIIYRCMLGKNMTDDFNASRNTHYKLTLVFNKDANDPDWHIEYDYEPEPPEMVTHPVFITYLANRTTDIPVIIYKTKKSKIKSLTATIVQNDWGHWDHIYVNTNKDVTNGFLSMELIPKTAVIDRKTEYCGTKTFNADKAVESSDTAVIFKIPVFTRPMNLGSGFSGNNYYVGRRRHAKVEITAVLTMEDNREVKLKDTVDVTQVRRLVNPKGIWRAGNSTKEFHVKLKNSDSSPAVAHTFEDVRTEIGPWSAKIIKGDDWVRIRSVDSDEWGTEPVKGGTGSVVEFYFKPKDENNTTEPRFGLIEVRVHDNTCPHVILVSQGMGPVEMKGNKWHMSNVKYCGEDEENPLLEGSMFKFGCSTVAYKSSNNLKSGYGFRKEAFNKTFDVYYTNSNGVTTETTRTFTGPTADAVGFTNKYMKNGGSHVATYAEWESLNDTTSFDRYYGVLYGDECDSTLSTNTVTNTYTKAGEEKGMRGCFVCEKTTGKHLFFPIGNTGHGRRHYRDDESSETCKPNGSYQSYWGELKYANRVAEMLKDKTDGTPYATNLPCLYDLWEEPGAVYWFQEMYNVNGKDNGRRYAFDINYMTFGFEPYTTKRFYAANEVPSDATHPNPGNAQSDLCFIRRVYDK